MCDTRVSQDEMGTRDGGCSEVHLQESWYEKLQRWDEALEAYEKKSRAAPPMTSAWQEACLGRLRCLAALAEWDRLTLLARQEWHDVLPQVPLACLACPGLLALSVDTKQCPVADNYW
jgi:phosphatidylinositol kinase/protein kinase (PI-3  family)